MKGLTFPLYFTREELDILLKAVSHHRMRLEQKASPTCALLHRLSKFHSIEKSLITAIAELKKLEKGCRG